MSSDSTTSDPAVYNGSPHNHFGHDLSCFHCEPLGHGYLDLGGLDGDYLMCEKCHQHWPCETVRDFLSQAEPSTVPQGPNNTEVTELRIAHSGTPSQGEQSATG